MAKVTLIAGITSLRGKMDAVYYRTNRNGYNSIFFSIRQLAYNDDGMKTPSMFVA